MKRERDLAAQLEKWKGEEGSRGGGGGGRGQGKAEGEGNFKRGRTSQATEEGEEDMNQGEDVGRTPPKVSKVVMEVHTEKETGDRKISKVYWREGLGWRDEDADMGTKEAVGGMGQIVEGEELRVEERGTEDR